MGSKCIGMVIDCAVVTQWNVFDMEFNILSFAFGFLSFMCTQHNDPADMAVYYYCSVTQLAMVIAWPNSYWSLTFYSAEAVDIWAFGSLNTEKVLLASSVYQLIESLYDNMPNISDNFCI